MKFSKLCFFAFLFSACTCVAQMYTVTDLRTLGGSWSEATSINAFGQVVGVSQAIDKLQGPLPHAFRTAPERPINPSTDDLVPGTCVDLGTDICVASALGINNGGQVVGTLHYLGADPAGFRTEANQPISIDTDIIIDKLFDPYAYGINNLGQVVGADVNSAFLLSASSISDWLDLGPHSIADALNDLGQSVGQSAGHAFRTAPNAPINLATDDLGTLGGSFSEATSINAFGQVVGWADISGDASFHPFRTAPKHPINPATDDLGTFGGSMSSATSINNFGQVVGWSYLTGDSVQHAFLYDGGIMHDLNQIVPRRQIPCPISGTSEFLQLDNTNFIDGNSPAINDAGQIAANVICNGLPHAVRLDPIYKASVQPPINGDGSSVFNAKRGVLPVKFAVTKYNTQPSCTLPATISLTRASNTGLSVVGESTYANPADNGSNFRIDSTACQYIYNLAASSLGVGTYRVDISINGIMVGHAVFALK